MSADSFGTPVIEVRGLHAGYGGIAVVHDLSMHVEPGEVVVLLGPNGAGKTTTLLTLSGLLAPISGEVEVFGAPVDGVAPHLIARRGLAHVPEDRSLFFDLTVDEHLRLGLTGRRASRRAARDRAMDLLPALRPLGSRKAGLLSGGEQQMLALGRALVSEPKCLLVVEQHIQMALAIPQPGLRAQQRTRPPRRHTSELSSNHELVVESYLGVRAEPDQT